MITPVQPNILSILIGIREIKKGLSSSILLVDEIGHLELRGEGFVKVLSQAEPERLETAF